MQRVFDGFYALFLVDVFLGKFLGVLVRFLQQNDVGKRLQALFLGDGCARAAFGTVRTIQVVHSHLCFCRFDFRAKFVGKFALFLDTFQYLRFLFFKVAKVGQAFKQFAQLLVVEAACRFLAVT